MITLLQPLRMVMALQLEAMRLWSYLASYFHCGLLDSEEKVEAKWKYMELYIMQSHINFFQFMKCHKWRGKDTNPHYSV